MAAKTAMRAAPAGPPEIVGDDLAGGEEEPRRGLTRGVVMTGLALGVTLVTYMYSDGIHPRLPGIPAALGYLAGFAIVMLVALAIATAVSYALRWHHREIAAWSWGRGKQAATWGYGHGRRHGARLRDRLAAWAGPHWQAAGNAGEHDDQAGDAGPAGQPGTDVAAGDDGHRDDQAGAPAPAAGLDGPTVPRSAPAADAPAPAATTRDGDGMTTS